MCGEVIAFFSGHCVRFLQTTPQFSKMPAGASTAAAMAKWWGKHVHASGLIQRTLSPFEHNVIGTLVQNGAQKVCPMPYVDCVVAVCPVD